jgi:hypothetical protein
MREGMKPIEIREMLLQIVREAVQLHGEDSLQFNTVRIAVRKKLGRPIAPELERAVLEEHQRLFATGVFVWGINFDNPNPPFFHVGSRGKRALANQARDPANPAGYLRHLASIAPLNSVALSYLTEGLDCFNDGHYKSAAVMVGAAAESLLLELRDSVSAHLVSAGKPVPSKLGDWRAKTILDGLGNVFDQHATKMPRDLREPYEANFRALQHPIRTARNDAGHPSGIDPVQEEAVHAMLILFPELYRLLVSLTSWSATGFR